MAASSPEAAAEEPFEADVPVDAAITGASFAGFAALHWLVERDAPTRCAERACGPTGDGARRFDSTWDVVSYVPVSLAVGGALSPALGRAADGGDGLGSSSLVLSEALGLTLLATEAAKLFVPRPRPFLAFEGSGSAEARASTDAVASFWSGHSALAFSAAAVGSFDACRAPNPLGCLGPALTLHALAASTAWGRILAGKHHVSDVVVGGAVGGAIGTAVAFAHGAEPRRGDATAGRTVAGAQLFMVSTGWVW